MSYEHLLVDRDGAVARVTMNRPDRLNALNVQLGLELMDAFTQLEQDGEVRAIVLTGAGRGFCAGDDLKGMTDPGAPPGTKQKLSDPARQYVDGVGRWPAIVRQMTRLPKPIVAMVNGHAHGAGFNLALGADFRVMADTATLAIPFVKWAMATGTNRLQQFVGVGKALEWALLGTTLSAAEAERWGLVTRVVPPDQLDAATAELAHRLAEGPTAVLGYTKAAIYAGWQEDADASYGRQGLAQHFARQTDDYAEGKQAFAQKRPPRYSGKGLTILDLP